MRQEAIKRMVLLEHISSSCELGALIIQLISLGCCRSNAKNIRQETYLVSRYNILLDGPLLTSLHAPDPQVAVGKLVQGYR
jgi:hypothetical protein